MNNSWGFNGGDRFFETDIEELVAAGIFIEVSAGNEGPDLQLFDRLAIMKHRSQPVQPTKED